MRKFPSISIITIGPGDSHVVPLTTLLNNLPAACIKNCLWCIYYIDEICWNYYHDAKEVIIFINQRFYYENKLIYVVFECIKKYFFYLFFLKGKRIKHKMIMYYLIYTPYTYIGI